MNRRWPIGRRSILGPVLVLALTATACAGDTTVVTPPPGSLPDRPAELETGTVTWIVDGDTLEIDASGDTLEVRLIGVNAPEQGECFADAALDYMIESVKGREVGIEEVGVDQFDRVLANIWVDDQLLNLVLVRSGMAIAQTPDPANPTGADMLDAEDVAYLSGEGMWAPTACGDSPEYSVELDLGQVDPPGPDDEVIDDEYIVVVNRGTGILDLAGWTLRDESSRNRLVFSEGDTIGPGEEITVSSGCTTSPGWCSDTPIWNNDGDMALLLDDEGNVVARARY